jgi:hypothetical protein
MKRGYLFIALATLFFSTMEIALKEVAGQFNPVQLNLTRFLMGLSSSRSPGGCCTNATNA